LLVALEELRRGCVHAEHEFAVALSAVLPMHHASARNLVHYVALRRHDLRDVQEELTRRGLSSLGRSEAHVLDSLDTVLDVLRNIDGAPNTAPAAALENCSSNLARNAELLLGPLGSDRSTRIMVTMPSGAADDPGVAAALVGAGMDIARINCAHDAAVDWQAMARHVREAAKAQGRPVLIAMDLAGPKLRTGSLPLGPPIVRVRPQRDARGVVVRAAVVMLHDDSMPAPLPSSATPVPVHGAKALVRCRVGDVIKLRDARNARRRLLVVATGPAGVVAETRKTIYFETGIRLRFSRGPAHRASTIGPLPQQPSALTLNTDDELVLTREPDVPATGVGVLRVSCTLPEVFDHACPGQRVWFDDGKVGGIITGGDRGHLTVKIVDSPPGGARLREAKGINLPDTDLPIAALTAQDDADLTIAAELADIIDVSFIRTTADVELVQARVRASVSPNIGLVLKIETVAGFEQLPSILLAAMGSERFGVMIARGDLAVEAGYERMAEVQEEILWLCEAGDVPVIWATQVLDQLARTGRPSRAEVTDAALAARAECIMLNKGPHIVSAITTLLDINHRMRDHQYKKQSLLRRLRAWDHLA
jgi:pyruvate kinase